MRNLFNLVAISAALSASILTGLALADVSTTTTVHPGPAFVAAVPATATVRVSNQPSSKPAISCTQSAWTSADGFCVTDRADAAAHATSRRVRIIRVDGETARNDGSLSAAAFADVARR